MPSHKTAISIEVRVIPEDLRAPITSVLLKENQNLAIVLPLDVSREPRYRLYFFRIIRRYPLHRTYNEEMSPIGAGGLIDPNYVGETGIGSGDDLFRIWGERPFRIYHFGVGIRPSEIWLYKAIPGDTIQTGWGMELPPRVSDKRDYISGYLSPYDEPTVATETILYPKISMHLGFKNDSARTIRPALRFLGAGYDLMPIKNPDVINKLIAGIIPCRFLTIGGLRMFSFVTPGEWVDYGVELTMEKLEEVLKR